MKVGLYVTNQHYLDKDMVSALEEQIAMVHHVRDRGWDSLFSGQHVWCKNFIGLDSSKWVGLSKFPKLAFRNRMDVTRSISDDLGWIWCISVHR
jgi:hypothetical protein